MAQPVKSLSVRIPGSHVVEVENSSNPYYTQTGNNFKIRGAGELGADGACL